MKFLEDLDALHALYGTPAAPALRKEVPALTAEYRALIEAAPFCALATIGPEGLDCSPRGDVPGFVRVLDDRTLALPDRFGNNRIDSLRNVVRDPRVSLMFLIPGCGNALRVNGRARITADAALRESFAVEGQAPRSVAVIAIETVYYQCARAIIRSRLWGDTPAPPLPTPGRMLAAITAGEVGGADYDAAWPARAEASMW
jgi:uncharacterized protein